MTGVAIGWELYERTNSALALGLVGLVQVLPVILLSLVAGHVADRFNRKRVVIYSRAVLVCCAIGLAVLSVQQGPIPLVYACLFLIGVSHAFGNPAASTLLPQTVPPEAFANAATWSSSSWQLASVLGPTLGGVLIALTHSAAPIYVLDALCAVIYLVMLVLIRGREIARSTEAASLQSLLAGFRFIWNTKAIMAAITLDLFSVLFGGATALLPIYARDILQVGPGGLGWLRAAPSIGAVLMALAIVYFPPFRRAGMALLWAVAGFGVATIIFGLSTNFWLSLAMLALLGGLDNISVVVRGTLMLTRTPDEMRGRASAVNSVFISASNELGALESGIAAALLGPVLAVVTGGIGTLIVVAVVARIWPEIRQLGRLNEPTAL